MRPVVWSIEAQRDNLELLRYIAEDNPFAAERVVDAIEDADGAPRRPDAMASSNSARVNQRASSSSTPSTWMSGDAARAAKPSMSERGKGQGWLDT